MTEGAMMGDFGWAVHKLFNGYWLRRHIWPAGRSIKLVQSGDLDPRRKVIDEHLRRLGNFIVEVNGHTVMPWCPTHTDLLSGDWRYGDLPHE